MAHVSRKLKTLSTDLESSLDSGSVRLEDVVVYGLLPGSCGRKQIIDPPIGLLCSDHGLGKFIDVLFEILLFAVRLDGRFDIAGAYSLFHSHSTIE